MPIFTEYTDLVVRAMVTMFTNLMVTMVTIYLLEEDVSTQESSYPDTVQLYSSS